MHKIVSLGFKFWMLWLPKKRSQQSDFWIFQICCQILMEDLAMLCTQGITPKLSWASD